MSISIKQIHNNEFTINQKRIYKDIDGTWIAKQELTQAEIRAFRLHIGKSNITPYNRIK